MSEATRSEAIGGTVEPDEVLLLYRALVRFAGSADPSCAPTRAEPQGRCPLVERCPRWATPSEDAPNRRRRARFVDVDDDDRAAWPCSRVLDLLDPEVNWISRR